MNKTTQAWWYARLAIAIDLASRNPVNWRNKNAHPKAYASVTIGLLSSARRHDP